MTLFAFALLADENIHERGHTGVFKKAATLTVRFMSSSPRLS